MSEPSMAGKTHTISRRELLRQASAAVVVSGLGSMAFAQADKEASTVTDRTRAFPDKFLWGTATAGHQVEGNNTTSDMWLLEHLPKSIFKDPSGDACDHYHLYPQDIAMVAELGFNTYRFSLEWARIEPEEGFVSNAELEHYRRMLASCHEHGLTPMLTYSHFTVPRWFAMQGAWESSDAADHYARFCERATRHLGDLVGYASTMNEPDIPQLLDWLYLPPLPGGMTISESLHASRDLVRRQTGSPRFAGLFLGDGMKTRDGLLASHAKAKEAMKSVRPDMPVGFNLAMSDDQPAPEDSHLPQNSHVEEKRAAIYGPWLEAAKHCDYMGVQVYSRSIVGKKDLPPPKGAELTQTGMEFYPECVGHTVRYASKATGVPIYVTENGIATEDDSRRVEYIQRALVGLKQAIDDGVDVRGYIAWSLLDNFEWMSGYSPKFGIVAVDLKNQKRTIKPSAAILGNIARRNAL